MQKQTIICRQCNMESPMTEWRHTRRAGPDFFYCPRCQNGYFLCMAEDIEDMRERERDE